MTSFWHKIKARPWLSAGLILMLFGAGYFAFGRGGDAEPETSPVERGTIIEEVSLTGKTQATDNIDLAFEKSGRVTRIGGKVSDRVAVGQMLVQLDQSELLAQLTQAEANVMREQARLDQLVRGARPEDLAIKRAELDKAQQDLKNEYVNAYEVLQDAFAKADDAVRKQTDDLFLYEDSSSPKLTFTISDNSRKLLSEQSRAQMEKILNEWKADLDAMSNSSADASLDEGMRNAKNHLYAMRDFLSELLDIIQSSLDLSATTSATYKTNVSGGRTSVNAAVTSVASQEQQISSQKLVAQRIQSELNLKLAGTAPEEIDAQRAQLRQAQASVAAIQAQLAKTVLRSPIRGVVTEQTAKVGQIVSPNSPIVSIISDSNFEIETNIPEADVQKVKVGDKASITLDAYGSSVQFEAQVGSVDPAETVIEGVVTYKAKLVFLQPDERIRSGMTANIDIRTNERKDVVVVAQRAVLSEDGERYVFIYREGVEPEKRKVTTGLRGMDGNIEITSGLSAGEVILRVPPAE